MFSLAIYDSSTDSILLARDRLGIKPLIYYLSPDLFVFSSELKVLRHQRLVPTIIDPVSVMSLLRFGSVAQPKTIFKDVSTLLPGHFLVIQSDGSYSQEPYCTPFSSAVKPWQLDYETTIPLLRTQLESATRAHLIADVEVGCFLSGGVDSTAVLALMQREVSHPIQSFSLGFADQFEVEDETSIAERSAAALGSRFHRIVVNEKMITECFYEFIKALDQPSIDGFNSFLISKAASHHVKIVLSGLGGDELFCGYPHFAQLPSASLMTPSPIDHFQATYIISDQIALRNPITYVAVTLLMACSG